MALQGKYSHNETGSVSDSVDTLRGSRFYYNHLALAHTNAASSTP